MDEIKLCPVTGWTTGTLPDACVLMTIEHVMTEAELVSGKRHELTFALTNAQAIELADTLLRKAKLSRAARTGAPPDAPRN